MTSALEWRVRKAPVENVSSQQNYFQTNFQSIIKVLFFYRNLSKIYRTAIAKWNTHQVVFFIPLMLVLTKWHKYLNKPARIIWDLLKHVWPFVSIRR